MYQATRAEPLGPIASILWKTAQITALLVTVVLLAGLLFMPELSLKIAWYGVVPLLPASFLINTGLWRGVCPIATANTLTGNHEEGASVGGRALWWSSVAGILLLVILVPARHFLLNTNGPVLAVLLAAIVVAALVTSRFVKAKGGFCNSVCPVLPVEKLYGQSPLLPVRNPRCIPCSLCTRKGCLDIDPAIALRHGTGERGGAGNRWLTSPLGMFSAAFPGFIIGYFLLSDGPLEAVLSMYGTPLLGALVSYVAVALLVVVLGIPSRIGMPVLAALSVGSYYWFAVPASFESFAWSASAATAVRAALLAFVVVWLGIALKREKNRFRIQGESRRRQSVAARLPAPV